MGKTCISRRVCAKNTSKNVCMSERLGDKWCLSQLKAWVAIGTSVGSSEVLSC